MLGSAAGVLFESAGVELDLLEIMFYDYCIRSQ